MPTKKIPYWSLYLSPDEQDVIRKATQFSGENAPDEPFDHPLNSGGDIISMSAEGLAFSEAAIDRWAIEGRPELKLARLAGQLCCRIQIAGRFNPSGYAEVHAPELAPVETQKSLFD